MRDSAGDSFELNGNNEKGPALRGCWAEGRKCKVLQGPKGLCNEAGDEDRQEAQRQVFRPVKAVTRQPSDVLPWRGVSFLSWERPFLQEEKLEWAQHPGRRRQERCLQWRSTRGLHEKTHPAFSSHCWRFSCWKVEVLFSHWTKASTKQPLYLKRKKKKKKNAQREPMATSTIELPRYKSSLPSWWLKEATPLKPGNSSVRFQSPVLKPTGLVTLLSR